MEAKFLDAKDFKVDQESFQVNDEAFQIATAPVLRDVLDGTGRRPSKELLRAKEHKLRLSGKSTNSTAALSTEAMALADYLLKGLNFRLEAMEFRLEAIGISVSGLEESFKSQEAHMNGRQVQSAECVDEKAGEVSEHQAQLKNHWAVPQKVIENSLETAPPLDSQVTAVETSATVRLVQMDKVTGSVNFAPEVTAPELSLEIGIAEPHNETSPLPENVQRGDNSLAVRIDGQIASNLPDLANSGLSSQTKLTQITSETKLTQISSDKGNCSINFASASLGITSKKVGSGHGTSIYGRGVMSRATTAGMFGEHGPDKTQLDQEEYNVFNFYHESGWAQWIARSETFSNVTLGVIAVNAVYIGYDADNNKMENLLDADLQFRIMENLFCVFFFGEWIIRFCAFRNKLDGLKDMWFKFDSLLVTLMVLETWVFPVALSGGTGIPSGLIKLVRLLRLARMTRLMRAFPELVAMIKGVKVASRAVGSALLMLVGLVYVFAIIMFTLLKNEENELVALRFRKLGVTMWTLLIDGTFLDSIGVLSRALMDANHYFSMCLLLVFVLLSALTVMNMLIGVLCEVVSAVATAEKEDIAIRMVKDNLLFWLKELDEDNSGELSREEILEVLKHEEALAVLESLQVDTKHLMEHLDMFFEEMGALGIPEVLDTILMLRGDRTTEVKDLLHSATFICWKLNQNFNNKMDEIQSSLSVLVNEARRSVLTDPSVIM